jgi:hypothetical protein
MVMARMGRTAKVIRRGKDSRGKDGRGMQEAIMEIYKNKAAS